MHWTSLYFFKSYLFIIEYAYNVGVPACIP